MKKLFLLVAMFATLMFAPQSQAANTVYVSQAGAGDQSGLTDCTHAKPASYFNNAANWVSVPSGVQIGPNTTVRLCGTFTGTTSTTMLTPQGDGTSGNPITILAQSGVDFTNNVAWPQTGAINLAGRAWLVVDGGVNGIIENTDNGTDRGHNLPTNGINASVCNNCIIQNWNLNNLYHTVASGSLGSNDRSFLNAITIGGTNVSVLHNHMVFCMWCIQEFYNGHNDSGIDIGFNVIHEFDHGWIAASAAGSANTATNLKFHDNELYDTASADNIGHHDGIHLYQGAPHLGSAAQVYIYNNYFHGAWGTTPTGFIFIEGGTDAAKVTDLYFFNNVGRVENPAAENTNGWIGIFGVFGGVTQVYNNTIIGHGDNDNTVCFNIGSINNLTFKNNVIDQCEAPVNFGFLTNTTTTNWDNNAYGVSCQHGGNCFIYNNTFLGNFSNWKATTGGDAHSIQNNSLLLDSLGAEQTGSPIIGLGANLSGISTGPLAPLALDTSRGGQRTPATRAGAGSWDGGAYNFGASAPAPLVTFQTVPLAFGNQPVGVASTALTETIINSGSAPLVFATPFFTVTGDFAEVTGGSCANGGSVAASASCTVQITFTPTVAGARTGTLTINSNASGVNSVSLTGTGTAGSMAFGTDPLAFAPQAQFTTSAPLTEQVRNTGSSVITLATPYFTVTDPSDAADFVNTGAGSCVNGGTIAVGSFCTVTVTFRPHTQAAESAHLNILGSVNSFVNMTGQGTAPTSPAITFAPSGGLAFGSQTVGSPQVSLTETLTNSGSANLVLSGAYATLGGTNPGEFSNLGTGTCANNLSLIPGASCTIKAAFAPATAGAKSATITINSNASGVNSFALTGTGVAGAGHMTVGPASLGFGSVTQGTTSAALTLTIGNDGTAALVLTGSYQSKSGALSADYNTSATGTTCSNNLSIAIGGSCLIKVTFSPSTNTTENVSLTVSSTISSNVTVAMSGLGTAPVAVFTPNPTLAFGNQTISTDSSPLTLTVTNTGNSNLVLGNTPFITKSGANPGDFNLSTGGTCTALGTVTPGANCTIKVIFTPAALGARAATFTLVANAVTSVNLTGTGIAAVTPAFTLSPNLTFPSTTVGATSGAQTMTLLNSGNTTETFTVLSETGNTSDFTPTGATTCIPGTTVLNPGDSCTLVLTFTPTTVGARSIAVTLGSVNATASATASGTGLAATFTISLLPTPVTFADTTVGSPSATQTATVANTGTGTLTFSTPFFTKATGTPADFAVTGGTCANGGTLAPAASCTVILTFTPSTPSLETTTLTVSTTASTSAATQLKGQGIASGPHGAPTVKSLLLAYNKIEMDGTDFVPGVSKIFVNNTSIPTTCPSTTVCTATTSSSLVLLPLLRGASVKLELR